MSGHATGTSAAIRCPNCGELLKYEGEHWEQGGYFCRAIPNSAAYDNTPDYSAGTDVGQDEGEWAVPPDATPNRVADQGADYVIARAIRERNPDYRMPELMAWDIVKRLREAGFDV